MGVKLFKLDKYRETPEAFQSRVNEWVKTTGDVKLLDAFENLNTTDIVFAMQYSDNKSLEQELCVLGYMELEKAEGAVNAAISGLQETGRLAQDIKFVTTSKSPRALAVFVVEGSGSGTSDSTIEPEEKKQDTELNVSAKPRRQRKVRPAN